MSKIALIADTHFGCRQDNNSLLDYQSKFLHNVFFPTLEENNIDTIVHLGDLVDRRRYINFYTANKMRCDFINPWKDKRMIIIPGNHDIYYKNSIQVNALQELLSENKNIEIVMDPTSFTFGNGFGVLMVPWICEENQEKIFNAIHNSNDSILLGHLELHGFEMHKGVFSDHGHDPNSFNKFDLVCSGHFHHKSTYNNINYLGSPWQMTWSDYGDTKGFHILDTKTHELTFIENKYNLFNKIKYNDKEELLEKDYSEYADTYVKVIVQEKNNPYWFDLFITKLEEANVIDVQVVEDHLNLNLETADDIINSAESTLDILANSIKSIDIKPELEKKLETLLRELYNEANIINA